MDRPLTPISLTKAEELMGQDETFTQRGNAHFWHFGQLRMSAWADGKRRNRTTPTWIEHTHSLLDDVLRIKMLVVFYL